MSKISTHRDFLKRCTDYELFEPVPTTADNNAVATASANANNEQINLLTQQVLHRNQKLEKYRKKKELEDQIKHLKVVIKGEEVDDDTKRDYYLKLLNMSVIEAQEELSSIEMEKQMLKFQQQDRQQAESVGRVKTPPVRPLKPIIFTKDLAQKAVYGMGYPSLPTMTVSEFYDQRVREGIFPDPNNAPPRSADNSLQSRFMQEQNNDIEEQEDIDREEKLDMDDDYELARLRARDEYKDDHRRGEGNRYNRS